MVAICSEWPFLAVLRLGIDLDYTLSGARTCPYGAIRVASTYHLVTHWTGGQDQQQASNTAASSALL